MRIAATGSIATDHLFVFPGRFADQLVADRLEHVSLSFLADTLEVRRGGVAANIALGLGRLGLSPVLVGAVGADFAEYETWLKGHGVDTGAVHVSAERQTARFVCTTDAAQNQIATFYGGAMAEAREIDLAAVAERTGGLDLVVVSPNDPAAMVRHTRDCRALGIPFAADPSQQLARLEPAEARELVDGSALLFTNAYEAALLQERTGWSEEEILSRTGVWITTLGAQGARIARAGAEPLVVEAVPVAAVADPTGGGDAFRSGYLAAYAQGLDARRSAQLGCTLAAVVLEAVGGQEYRVDRAELAARVRSAYGADAVAELDIVLATIPTEEKL
ncbi:carbohydrate kinase family protein [Streptomyces kaniharaensis]|uniref:Carbohydrate kinase family protein n=1 Tax=Streptomyces kaniharaensis TaxID=212423 RepID=A0A6N7KTI7_9ACTN|nr:carbohydrate kinase family protein [Streptomyces kaniharaensis]MQS14896.1 carbohydrate kinase family protein [Streptomyces kaniharaensis]